MIYVADYDKTPMPAQANMGVVIGFYVRTNILLRTVAVGVTLLAYAAAGLPQHASSTLFPA